MASEGSDTGARRAALADALGRIRHLKTSKLENQRAPAQLLVAIEATLAERNEETGPTQYLLALESLLSAEPAPAVAESCIYLLASVLPHVAPGVVRAKSLALLAAVAAPLAAPHGGGENMNARLRAALGCVEALLLASAPADRALLERERAWLGVWDSVLALCVDARPKVRRRAHELVVHVLGAPAWAHAHPYASRTMHWAAGVLASVVETRGVAAKGPAPTYDKKSGIAKHARAAAAARQNAAEGAASSGIWVCALLRDAAPLVPPPATAPLVPELLALPSLQNPFLTVATFDVFSAMFRTTRADVRTVADLEAASSAAAGAAAAPALLEQTLATLRDPRIVPPPTDVQILPAYLGVLEACMVAYSPVGDGSAAWALVPELFADVMERALSARSDAARASADVRTAARTLLLALVRYCVPDAAVAEALARPDAPLHRMIDAVRSALGRQALHYAHARADILHVLAGLVTRLRIPPREGAPPPATALLLDAVVDVAALRAQRDFDARGDADAVLCAALEACGPAAVLARLPLNLLDAHKRPNSSGTGRAWLLPLLRASVTNTELGYFVRELVPLSEALFELKVRAEQPESGPAKPVEAKVFEALIEQVWACFPNFCDLARDVDEAVTPRFLELLVNVLRTQRPLRPSVLRGLELLVERTTSLAASTAPRADLVRQFGVDQVAGRRFAAHVGALAPALLSALFQLVADLPAQERGYVMECIATYVGVLDADKVAAMYDKVAGLLQQSLATYTPAAPAPGKPEPNSPRYVPPVPHTMLDLLIVLAPHVRGAHAAALYELVQSDALLAASDNGLQKKAYRVLLRWLSGPARHVSAAALVCRLAALTDAVRPGAVRDRLQLLAALVPRVDELHVLGAIVPEAVLGTKEANQGARDAAYELLMAMGARMAAGGALDRAQAAGGEADAGTVVEASVNEYIMMVAAGLAGATPRMISASITALARLLYEYHAEMPAETLGELLSTMVVYLESTNREIVKSALGFCKVAVVVLDAERVAASLAELVPALLAVSRVHKNHFKGRVRHMIERLIRRFGVDAVAAHVDAENQRLIANIRKRKERLKRRRATGGSVGEEPTADAFQRRAGSGSMDAFEEALYGSGSEDEDASSEGEDEAHRGRSRYREDDAYLLEDGDVPMDLHDQSAVGAIRTRKERKAPRQPGDEAKMFATDERGRLRIADEDAGAEAPAPTADEEMAGRAYLEREVGVDGFTFGRGGAVKFNKNTKRTRANERADDEGGADDEPDARPRRAKRAKQAIGGEFRAKRAEGDVQKNGMSPYAYVPLASVTGKKNARQAQRLAITGKRKK